MEKYLGVKLIEAEPQFKCIKDICSKEEPVEILYLTDVSDVENNSWHIQEGYKVVYEDGYISWSPKDVFEKAYRKINNLTFGLAIEALKQGKLVARQGWNGKGMFICKQIPANIEADIVPKMQSLPQDAKDKLKPFGISYRNQMLIVNADRIADSWVASSSDIFAEDWYIVTP